MWRGQLTLPDADAVGLGFIYLFLIGGITGVIVASPPLDFHFQDTYFVVAHLHNVLVGGTVFAMFAGDLLLVPEGHRPAAVGAARASSISGFWMVGFTLTFLPQYQLGLLGMPRRFADYPATPAGAT